MNDQSRLLPAATASEADVGSQLSRLAKRGG